MITKQGPVYYLDVQVCDPRSGRPHTTPRLAGPRLPIDPQAWSAVPATILDAVEDLETRARLRAITAAILTELSPHQREVLTALVRADVRSTCSPNA
jgi:hypothetical protein